MKLSESRQPHRVIPEIQNGFAGILSTASAPTRIAPPFRRQAVMLAVVLTALSTLIPRLAISQETTRSEAAAALRKAARFYQQELGAEGGYVWRYSSDAKYREGESVVGPATSWVQPPGTPTVGLAFLEAYQLTGLAELKQAAIESGLHLASGQLKSGGWDYRIETESKARERYAYRTEPTNPKGRNTTTLDDDTSQSALRFLIRLDIELKEQNQTIHRAATSALDALLKAQYPNGAWPQRFSQFPNPSDHPVLKARYPETWSRTYPRADYRSFYTLNDNTLADTIDTMLLAYQAYERDEYRKAAEQGGGFLILAQMPEPQPAWAQQYNSRMEPAWARKFEPPAVTGGESHGAIRILIRLYLATGDDRFLEPVPRALDYLERSQLADGRLARFYELKTNRPLYFTREYELTYDDGDLPTHYGFIVSSKVKQLRRELTNAREKTVPLTPKPLGQPQIGRTNSQTARRLIDSLDERGAWVTADKLRYHKDLSDVDRIIDSRVFSRNLVVLAGFVRREER